MATDAQQVAAHYGRQDLGEQILDGLRRAGKDIDALTPDDLAPVDQFHIGGKAATLDLARRAELQADWRVLDLGGGLGGPARTLAAEFGCHVTVLDLTAEYCRVGAMLTERTGLGDRVAFQQGDALAPPFPDASFDLVWTQHSSMNIADKERLYAQIARLLRPGGRLAFHEIMAGPQQPIHFPVPWARDPAISFLRPPDAVRAVVTASGFTPLAWTDVAEASRAWWEERLAAAAGQSPAPLGFHLLLGPDATTMGANILRNLTERRITVVQAVFARQ